MRNRLKWLTPALVATALVAAACGNQAPNGPAEDGLRVGLAYDIGGRGDQSFNDAAARGLDEAKAKLRVAKTQELEATAGESDQAKEQRLRLLAQQGFNPIIAVGFAYAGPLQKIAGQFPGTRFALIDSLDAHAPNVANLVFAEQEGSYLVGAAAALKSKTETVGFIGGANTPIIGKFLAGFEAGVTAVSPKKKVLVQYLSQAPDFSGFSSPDKGRVAADGMYQRGADIVFSAAGGSSTGIVQAAHQSGKRVIGVDSDQYLQPALASAKDAILTSMVKRVDRAVLDFVADVEQNRFVAGEHLYGLKQNGVTYATSGGFVDDVKPRLEQMRQAIVDGTIVVPTTPKA
ncbi:BMP family ABC transporter substrate-binding protein [Nonomuraea rosea]|uniref:BMP family ABC transporter substrate-binding protein n=1 Tax=Nonomuraea rosea TaxID=638574 RepID=A0ABP6ZG56_9ACTN